MKARNWLLVALLACSCAYLACNESPNKGKQPAAPVEPQAAPSPINSQRKQKSSSDDAQHKQKSSSDDAQHKQKSSSDETQRKQKSSSANPQRKGDAEDARESVVQEDPKDKTLWVDTKGRLLGSDEVAKQRRWLKDGVAVAEAWLTDQKNAGTGVNFWHEKTIEGVNLPPTQFFSLRNYEILRYEMLAGSSTTAWVYARIDSSTRNGTPISNQYRIWIKTDSSGRWRIFDVDLRR